MEVILFVDYGQRIVSAHSIYYGTISNQYKVTVVLPKGYYVAKNAVGEDDVFDKDGWKAIFKLDRNDRIYIIGTDYPDQFIYVKETSKESLNLIFAERERLISRRVFQGGKENEL